MSAFLRYPYVYTQFQIQPQEEILLEAWITN